MNKIHELFHSKKPNFEKLLSFGFKKNGESYMYSTTIADGQFQMNVIVTKDENINTKVIDILSNEEYVLHRTQCAAGSFVGTVRNNYENVLYEISQNCFEIDVFKSKNARKIIQYVRQTYGDELEFLWEKFSCNAIFRRKDTKKWYGILIILPKNKLGLNSNEYTEILDLRMKTEDIEVKVDNKEYFPGYHMNKKHWVTIHLDGTLAIEEIFEQINKSYKLAKK